MLYDSKINAGRLADYHRIDLSAKKRIEFKNKTNMKLLQVLQTLTIDKIFFISIE